MCMVQNLTTKQLRDVTNVMFYTRMKHKNIFLKNTFVIGYTLVGLILSVFFTYRFFWKVRIFACMFGGLSFVCLALLVYIFICRAREKDRCKRLVRVKGGIPCTINFRKECIVCDGKAVNYRRFKNVYLYKGIYYLVDNNDVMVIVKCEECEKALYKHHHIQIIEKNRPFALI